jgi:hypothetical protein
MYAAQPALLILLAGDVFYFFASFLLLRGADQADSLADFYNDFVTAVEIPSPYRI